ncbi:hypothetical protein V1264_014106 [Littorina saxatilis]|uniref:PiggyBac transposable element-derived protein domain-containing protein n=2 Tax=Littorina saxatilis TaxID=31220 RepID=A0AAN9BRK6_9CAEN
MSDGGRRGGTTRSVFKRYSALEVLQECLNDQDSDDEDLRDGSDSESDEEETDFNQHHPLLSEVGIDDDNDISYEPSVSATDSDQSETDGSDAEAEPMPGPSTSCPVVRGRGRGRGSSVGRGQRGRGNARGRGRGRARQIPRQRQEDKIRNWTDADATAPNQDIQFQGNPGMQCNVDNFEPVDWMQLFFDDDLINHLVFQTNLYADQYLESHPDLSAFSRAQTWEKTNPVEMKKFLALLLLMGIVKLPSIDMYWTKKVLYRVPVFSTIMTRNRFQIILQMLHFNDNSAMPDRNDPAYDRLFKVRPVLDHLFERFQAVYEPRQSVCVDESLLLWKGRLVFRQYNPAKRARFGIKIYLCCESDGDLKGSGGYCYRFKVYAGKDDPINEVTPVLEAVEANNPEMSASERMVLFLMAPLLNKGYHVYTDNWYSSLRLYLYLLEKKTLACGTVRENRGIPQQLHGVRLAPGASVALSGDGKIVATRYQSTKTVHFLSTLHGHTEDVIPDRRRRGIRKRPQASTHYNGNMGGVDSQDQLVQPYDCSRKSMKWTKKIFFHFLQVAACNAFLLQKGGDKCKTLLQFLESLITSWLWPDQIPAVIEEDKVDDEVRLTGRHFIFPIPPTPMKDRPTRSCKVCWKKKTRRDVRYHCPYCPSRAALCFPQCFVDYHTKFIYWK